MKKIITLTMASLLLSLVLFSCGDGSGPTNPGVPPDGTADCDHYYTCSEGADFGCNPDAPVDFRASLGHGHCADRGCIGRPGQVPLSGGGVKVTFKGTGPQGSVIGMQKYDHRTGVPVGNK